MICLLHRSDNGELFLASSSQDKRIRLWKIRPNVLDTTSQFNNKENDAQNVHIKLCFIAFSLSLSYRYSIEYSNNVLRYELF